MTDTKTVEAECSTCQGTGLYIGLYEKNNAAVVCHRCDGTGKMTITYKPFTGRHLHTGVQRVFINISGCSVSASDVVTKTGTMLKFTEGGVPYEDWLNGATPKPVKWQYCPLMWTRQEWNGCKAKQANLWRTDVSTCRFFKAKDQCWTQYDQELKNEGKNEK